MTKMKAMGIPDVQMESFNVLLSYPISRSLSIVDPVDQVWNATLVEDPVDGVCTSLFTHDSEYLDHHCNG
jgi:hypothetical protein